MIAEILNGRDKKKKGHEIAEELFITLRDVLKNVEVERLKGKPICASTDYGGR